MKKRIVVKIGSSLLTNPNGQLAVDKLRGHVSAMTKAKEAGNEIVLVTSASIAAGFEKLGFSSRPKGVVPKQACAAVGQGLLMQHYNEAFSTSGITVAQVLLTKSDLAIRESYNNAFNTLTFLLEHDVVPIINQNDTTATEEISFGDNDTLAARVAAMLHANLCIIFTDTDGLYDSDPRSNPDAKQIPYVTQVTPEILNMTGDSVSGVGTGGMRSKVMAAELANNLGTAVFVADGRDFNNTDRILDILDGHGKGTLFDCADHELVQRKRQWILLHAKTQGTVVVDDGAAKALETHSLLPVGVKEVFGSFTQGDVVEVCDTQHKLIGKGIVNYSADLLRLAAGKTSDEVNDFDIQKIEVIHRDDWVGI